jgi:hypothetical protein
MPTELCNSCNSLYILIIREIKKRVNRETATVCESVYICGGGVSKKGLTRPTRLTPPTGHG